MNRIEIGRRLMMLRGDRTQREVAMALNITEAAVRQYEAGRRIPIDAIKKRMAEYFGMTVQDLFYID